MLNDSATGASTPTAPNRSCCSSPADVLPILLQQLRQRTRSGSRRAARACVSGGRPCPRARTVGRSLRAGEGPRAARARLRPTVRGCHTARCLVPAAVHTGADTVQVELFPGGTLPAQQPNLLAL